MTIRSEIEKALAAFAASQNPPIPLALEGKPFTKPPSGNFIEMEFLGSETTNPTVDGESVRKRGIIQVNCYTPDGKGMGPLERLTEAVVALFPFHEKELYQSFSVEQTPSVSSSWQDTTFRVAAVRIKYRQEL